MKPLTDETNAGTPPTEPTEPPHQPVRRLSAKARAALQEKAVRRYGEGASIRRICAETGRSYGFTHRLLTDAGVQMRRRGHHHGAGDNPGSPPPAN
ncbi:helix-turn-helix domain-containing protein [Actinoplanes sp. L3-i22]|uniref:helix-turn-helix domain-containing protein n=1 Tax=Actinoplanes sp. L3-i22 TaxID=2836373 RepID=UPI001C77FC6F|nr:helix-turn-helix domain-containing protein [Actinoplanes sp. L3-i22]BCY11081.1 hypothetical protein L3i22_061690 [Actinoplanes sp. L3-i22]